mmetsp:Transcript_19227/g.49205  ORF Transcript_19227/g.49205 Transcript_19227/m.49205 type:complete len:213 (-) Transcript_19227:635-1273(-)
MPQQMQATVPPGLPPGAEFQVQTAAGPMTLTVPPGAKAGDPVPFYLPDVAVQPVPAYPQVVQAQAMPVAAQPVQATIAPTQAFTTPVTMEAGQYQAVNGQPAGRWRVNYCDCFSDCCICLAAFFLPCVTVAQLRERVFGEVGACSKWFWTLICLYLIGSIISRIPFVGTPRGNPAAVPASLLDSEPVYSICWLLLCARSLPPTRALHTTFAL